MALYPYGRYTQQTGQTAGQQCPQRAGLRHRKVLRCCCCSPYKLVTHSMSSSSNRELFRCPAPSEHSSSAPSSSSEPVAVERPSAWLQRDSCEPVSLHCMKGSRFPLALGGALALRMLSAAFSISSMVMSQASASSCFATWMKVGSCA